MEQRIKFVLKILIFVPLGLYILSCTYHVIMEWFFRGKPITEWYIAVIGLLGVIALGLLAFALVVVFFRWLFDMD
jgi:hypothetical protein